jgi:hypothetical protein
MCGGGVDIRREGVFGALVDLLVAVARVSIPSHP